MSLEQLPDPIQKLPETNKPIEQIAVQDEYKPDPLNNAFANLKLNTDKLPTKTLDLQQSLGEESELRREARAKELEEYRDSLTLNAKEIKFTPG